MDGSSALTTANSGGGLWWFSRDGRQSRRIRPAPSLPTNPRDDLHAENVRGLPDVAGQRFVLMGLDHLTGRSGWIFRIVAGADGWTLLPVAVLDAEPEAWLVSDTKLLFVTESGLWSSDATGTQRLYEVDFGRYSPTSLIRGADTALYFGLRYYVLKLEEQSGGWRESWYLPSDCQKVQLKEYQCDCVK
jgi:hypothetical protein